MGRSARQVALLLESKPDAQERLKLSVLHQVDTVSEEADIATTLKTKSSVRNIMADIQGSWAEDLEIGEYDLDKIYQTLTQLTNVMTSLEA
jgi:hypothetical protein